MLRVFGPPPTEQITERLIGPEGAFVQDWKARVNAPVSQNVHKNRGGSLPRPKPKFIVKDVGPGVIVKTPRWRVTAARMHHVEPWLESLAYRVDTPSLKITFAGDTGLCNSIIALAKGCNVLVANCWDHQDIMESNGEAPGQTGTRDAAEMAKEAGVKKLILTHTGKRMTAPGLKEKAIAEIARHFPGEIIFGEEQMVLDME